MAVPQIDYQAVFRALPVPILLLTPDGVILDANDSIAQASGRPGDELIGRSVFDEFPDNPAAPGARATAELRESLRLVVATRESDAIAPIRYDVEDPGRPGVFEERYWTVVNTPILGSDGEVVMIAHRADEVTHIIRQLHSQGG
jgi:PAS domain S-box-containing protein